MSVLPPRVSGRLKVAERSVASYRATPAILGALGIWIAVGIVGNGSFIGSLRAGAAVGAFVALTGLGQLFVIATGNGNIDLSVPYVLTLSAYVASGIADGRNIGVIPAVITVIAIGATIGIVNALVIIVLRVPPIVGTLAVGFVVETIYLEISAHIESGVGSFVGTVSTGIVAGVPYIVIVTVIWAVIVEWTLASTWFGRQVLAIGQSAPAARLAHIRTSLLTIAVYVICAVTASLVGVLLAGYIGGASLDIGTSYQLGSIAVVVLGGCLIAGGVANTPGVLAASLFISLLVTFTNLIHVSAGVQEIIEGAVIVGLLATAGRERVRVT